MGQLVNKISALMERNPGGGQAGAMKWIDGLLRDALDDLHGRGPPPARWPTKGKGAAAGKRLMAKTAPPGFYSKPKPKPNGADAGKRAATTTAVA